MVLRHHAFRSPPDMSKVWVGKNTFFSVSSLRDHISIGLYRDYTELQESLNNCPICAEEELVGEPLQMILPLDAVRLTKFDLVSLIESTAKGKTD